MQGRNQTMAHLFPAGLGVPGQGPGSPLTPEPHSAPAEAKNEEQEEHEGRGVGATWLPSDRARVAGPTAAILDGLPAASLRCRRTAWRGARARSEDPSPPGSPGS